jgi:hypothetical protein
MVGKIKDLKIYELTKHNDDAVHGGLPEAPSFRLGSVGCGLLVT